LIRSSETPLTKLANSAGSSFTSSSAQLTPRASNFLAVAGPNFDREVNGVVSPFGSSFFIVFDSFLTRSFLGADFFLATLTLTGSSVTTFSTAFFSGFKALGLKAVLFFSLAFSHMSVSCG